MVRYGNRREAIEGGQVEGCRIWGKWGGEFRIMGGMEDCLVYG